MAVSFEYYRIFYYVAQYRNFTQAATVLFSSQPNVTRAMNRLEQELGCRLFVRSNRGVTLTSEGEKLYAHVKIAQEHLLSAEYELTADKMLQSGVVSISASETALHSLLLPVLRRFHCTYPGIRLRIANHTTPQALQALKSGAVELAVVTSPTEAAAPLREVRLKASQEILIAGPQLSHLASRTLHLRELPEYPLICLGAETKTYAFYRALFLKHGLTLSPDIEVATTDLILPMVENGLGLGFLPEGFAHQALANGSVVQLTLAETIPPRYICLVKDSHHTLSLAAQTLAQMLTEEA